MVAQPRQLFFNVIPVIIEDGIEDAAHVLNHYCLGSAFLYDPNRRWEKIALIQTAELFTRHRERRAGEPACHQIHAPEWGGIELPQILLNHVPVGAVRPERLAAVPIEFDKACVVEPGPLQTERLSACPSAQFKTFHLPSYRHCAPFDYTAQQHLLDWKSATGDNLDFYGQAERDVLQDP